MIAIGSNEAILFRILVAFFGEDRVVPHMSLISVCGGTLPESLHQSVSEGIHKDFKKNPAVWAKESKCLFTIVNEADDPCMVIDFVGEFDLVIDADHFQRQRFIKPVLEAAGIQYVTFNQREFSDLTKQDNRVELVHLLGEKIGIEDN